LSTHWAGPRVKPPDPNFIGTVSFDVTGSGAPGIALYTLTDETLIVRGGTVSAPAGTRLPAAPDGIRVPVVRARKIIAGDLAIPERLWQGSE
jgi:hypothetical protein